MVESGDYENKDDRYRLAIVFKRSTLKCSGEHLHGIWSPKMAAIEKKKVAEVELSS